MVDHGEMVLQEVVGDDGDVRFRLDEGKLFDVWIQHTGYMPHVIHNVHDEGSRKINITLYKGQGNPANWSDFAIANRTFDNVKKMKIPAEYLGDSLFVESESKLSDEGKKQLKKIQSIAKSQEKAQRKIDRFTRKRSKFEDKIKSIDADMADGSVSRSDGEQKKLNYQEKLVKYQQKMDKWAY